MPTIKLWVWEPDKHIPAQVLSNTFMFTAMGIIIHQAARVKLLHVSTKGMSAHIVENQHSNIINGARCYSVIHHLVVLRSVVLRLMVLI